MIFRRLHSSQYIITHVDAIISRMHHPHCSHQLPKQAQHIDVKANDHAITLATRRASPYSPARHSGILYRRILGLAVLGGREALECLLRHEKVPLPGVGCISLVSTESFLRTGDGRLAFIDRFPTSI